MPENCISVFEYEPLYADSKGVTKELFDWLAHTLVPKVKKASGATWVETGYAQGDYIKFKNYVGVVATPFGVHIEILPKCLKGEAQANNSSDNAAKGRRILLDMLCYLQEYSHVDTERALVQTASLPLLDIFIHEFLNSTLALVKRGLRNTYVPEEDNLPTLRGRLVFPEHIRTNICRRDRFFTRHDEFTPDRPENRLLHAALLKCRELTAAHANLLRQLCDHFEAVPLPANIPLDFQRVRIERDMQNYDTPLAWARLILQNMAPTAGYGEFPAPSLLYPMEKLFESFVTRKLTAALKTEYKMRAQACDYYLAKSGDKKCFALQPDMLVQDVQGGSRGTIRLVLDTKWKVINEDDAKYNISQADLYQMYAYGQTYLRGGNTGDGSAIALVYPQTDTFTTPSPAFYFADPGGNKTYTKLRLWAVPFALDPDKGYGLVLPKDTTGNEDARQLRDLLQNYVAQEFLLTAS